MRQDGTRCCLSAAARHGAAPRNRRGTIVAVIVAVLLSGCSLDLWNSNEELGTLTQLDGSTTPWRDCVGRAEDILDGVPPGVTFSCAKLRVPRNWSQPDGDQLFISLLRMRNTDQRDRIGSLLINPGGPGGSGIELAAQSALFLPRALQQRFDIVGFDPRGVGESAPVRCISDEFKDTDAAEDPNPDTAEFAEQIAGAAAVAGTCAQRYGENLKYYSTDQTARDLDAIRGAVGDSKLNYLGYSYGTLLGSVYAHMFPTKIRAMVLDGAVDPRQDSVAATEQQADGFEKAFDAFAENCRRRGSGCPLGADPRMRLQQILQQVRENPVPTDDDRFATEGIVVFATLAALYSSERWTTLETALNDVQHGKASGVMQLVDEYTGRGDNGHYDNSVDAQLAINCTDEKTSPSPDRIAALQQEWEPRYPLFGSALALSLQGCSRWEAPRDPFEVGEAAGAPPIVVVGTTGDPATPYGNTEKLAKLLGSGVVLTWQGEGHTAYPQNSCIVDAVNNYLFTLRVPDTGTRCT